MLTDQPRRHHHYFNMLMDSSRWDRFEPRAGDIIVCTPYKAGTTWMQMICALLVFQSTKFPRPLMEFSRWLDLRIAPIEEVIASYAGQQHRRIIKTHTPLDGLPYFEQATYLFCARDPREIFVSMWHHRKNQQIENLVRHIKQQGLEVPSPPTFPDDINEGFKLWLTQATFPWETDGYPYWSVFSHARTYWSFLHLPNVHAFHYADLKSDLAAEMRRAAAILGVDIDASLMPRLVAAAGFESMKRNADTLAPNANYGAWRSNAAFFHKGEHRQWEGLLNDENLALYETVKVGHNDSAMTTWLECGSTAMA